MNIKILKLVNGDDLVSNIEKKESKIILKNPARMMMFPTEEGGMGMALVPWLPYTNKEDFEIAEDKIIIEIDPDEEMRNQYNENFGSGLMTPPTDLII